MNGNVEYVYYMFFLRFKFICLCPFWCRLWTSQFIHREVTINHFWLLNVNVNRSMSELRVWYAARNDEPSTSRVIRWQIFSMPPSLSSHTDFVCARTQRSNQWLRTIVNFLFLLFVRARFNSIYTTKNKRMVNLTYNSNCWMEDLTSDHLCAYRLSHAERSSTISMDFKCFYISRFYHILDASQLHTISHTRTRALTMRSSMFVY